MKTKTTVPSPGFTTIIKGKTFEDFWDWLCRPLRTHTTLGGKRKFAIHPVKQPPKLTNSAGTKYEITEVQARKVWERYGVLIETREEHVASKYTGSSTGAGRNEGPYIAAAIRDFLGGMP